MKQIKKSNRGLTFSLSDERRIGTKFRYFINKKDNEILIVEDENGTGTVSRKKSGKTFKPLYDIRTKEVRDMVSSADYMEVEDAGEKIIVHVYRKIREIKNAISNNVIRIEDLFMSKYGEIVLDGTTGCGGITQPEFRFGKPTLFNEDYWSYLCSQAPISYKKAFTKEKKTIEKIYDVVSLFSGGGLLDYSFKDPKFRFVYGCDFDKDACETYRANIGNHIVCDDIRNIQASDIPNCDLVIGGPCCQGYSNANRIDINEDTAKQKRLLIDDYVRIVKEKQPSIFVIENVPQLLTKENGLYIDKVLNGLSEYKITCTVISDEAVGGYTTRKRAIVIGSKLGEINLPDTTIHTVNTVRDALTKVDSSWFNWNDCTNPGEGTKMLMSYVPEGGNWENIPEEVVIQYRSSHKPFKKGVTQSNTYKRLAMDRPGVTVPNWRKCILIHPTENRILNVSEAAALMGLDKNFKVLGSSLDAKQQIIGNGVTQAIGKIIKEHVLNAFERSEKLCSFA